MQPFYAEIDSFLHRLNPLSKVLATTPVMVFVALATDIYMPLAFIILTGLLILAGGRIPVERFLKIALPMLLPLIGFLLFYPLVVRRELVQDSPALFALGPIIIYQKGLLFGLATGLRIYALMLLSLPFSLTTDVADFIRALVQQWRVPYRIGYSALAVFRFGPMLQTELRVIQAAHKVRGISDKGGLRARYEQLQRYTIPLLATAIRQAERTALAMDGRAFGAFETRTYFRRMRFTLIDYLFVAGFWLISLLIILGLAWAGLLGRLTLLQRL